MVIEIPGTFIGSFKVGDNLRYNCNILCSLSAANADNTLNKMIVLQVGSILEAALSQIIYRAQNFNVEGVPAIEEADRQKISVTKIDRFATTIDILRKYNVLNGLSDAIYDDLHHLRKYRNKVHIQDDVNIEGASRDEENLFNAHLVEQSLDLNRRILQFLNERFPRPAHIHRYAGTLVVPA